MILLAFHTTLNPPPKLPAVLHIVYVFSLFPENSYNTRHSPISNGNIIMDITFSQNLTMLQEFKCSI